MSLLVLLVAWFLFLRPTTLAGSTLYVIATGGSMEPGIHGGDLVIASAEREYRVGDVVVYRIPSGADYAGRMVVHRIVGGDPQEGFVLQGDAAARQDPWRVGASDILGRAGVTIPAGGRVLLVARNPLLLASLAGGFAFAIVVIPPGRKSPSDGRGLAPLRAAVAGR